MIPRPYIAKWQEHAPWREFSQVEQDLIISRALVEIFSDEFLRENLAFRGGTALHKLYLNPASRYSEDIDLVQIKAGPIKPIMERIGEVVTFFEELQEKGFDAIPLMGNHEAMLIDAYENEKNTSKWIQNGGDETLKSFEINSVKDIESKYIQFFKDLRYYYSFEDYLFVHAGFNDYVLNPFTDYYSMLWKCKESYANPLLANKTIIDGHNPISISKCEERVLSKLNVINIDTGCVYKDKEGFGRLTAYDCNTERILFV